MRRQQTLSTLMNGTQNSVNSKCCHAKFTARKGGLTNGSS